MYKRQAEPGFWERIKAVEKETRIAERAAKGLPPKSADEGALSGVPQAMPALTRAVKLQNKAAKVGFDWPSLAPVLAKMREELAELDEALTEASSEAGLIDQKPANDVREEFGDLLFVMANVARHLDIDPEHSLREANAKFERRFRGIEHKLTARGRDIANATLEEMDAIWDEVKRTEKEDDGV